MKHVLLHVVSLLLVVECFAAGDINLSQDAYIGRLKSAAGESVDLFRVRSTADATIMNRYYTARAILKIPPGVSITNPLSEDDNRILRNEICASNILRSAGPQMSIGYVGLYKRFDTIYGISDNAFAGEPLMTVLRHLANESESTKMEHAMYYAANMVYILKLLDSNNIVWNNFDLDHFYVKPDGTLFAFDLSDASSNPDQAIRDQEKSEQRNQFVNDTLRKILDVLFQNPADVQAQFHKLVNNVGTRTAETARLKNWDIKSLENLTIASLGIRYLIFQTAFDQNIIAFLQRVQEIPYVPANRASIGANNFPADGHQPANNINRGNNGVGIEKDVLDLMKRGDGSPYLNFAALCQNWTGE